ncbi:MAG: DUF5658 family protein [Haloarculaceae archaeon]
MPSQSFEPTDADGVSGNRPTTARRRLRRWHAAARRHERLLWAIALATLLADVALTAYGLRVGLTEGNPIVRVALLHSGFAAMAGLKLLSLAVGLAAWALLPRRHRAVVPLGLALPWGGAVVSNAALLAG